MFHTCTSSWAHAFYEKLVCFVPLVICFSKLEIYQHTWRNGKNQNDILSLHFFIMIFLTSHMIRYLCSYSSWIYIYLWNLYLHYSHKHSMINHCDSIVLKTIYGVISPFTDITCKTFYIWYMPPGNYKTYIFHWNHLKDQMLSVHLNCLLSFILNIIKYLRKKILVLSLCFFHITNTSNAK